MGYTVYRILYTVWGILYTVYSIAWPNSDNLKSPQSIHVVEEPLSEDEYHVSKPRPAKRKKRTSNSLNASALSESFSDPPNTSGTKLSKVQQFQDSGIMTEDLVLTSTPKKSKRPRLEW